MERWNSNLLVVLLGIAATSAVAHHGIPGYDMTKLITVKGTITELKWRNPHIYFTVDATDGDGRSILVTIEGAALSVLRASGLTREQLAPGTRVTVQGFAKAKGLTAPMLGANVTFPDGSAFDMGPTQTPVAQRAGPPADSIAGKWIPSSSTAVPDFGRAMAGWPYRTAQLPGASDPTRAAVPASPDRSYCYRATSAPWQYVTGGVQTIEVTTSAVILRASPYGYLNERVVHLDMATHPAKLPPSVQGHSIGRWEGRTLVVDTVALTPQRVNPPRGGNARLIERFTLTEDRRQLRYEVTMEDPELLTAPATFSMLWTHRPDLDFKGDEGCDEEQARRFLKD